RRLAQASAASAKLEGAPAARSEQTAERLGPILEKIARRLGEEDPNAIPHAVVPLSTTPLAPLVKDRVDAFANHLDDILSAAFGAEGDALIADPEAFTNRERSQPPDPMALNIACIACKGHCCRNAHDRYAFLDVQTMS
ncbi:MAG: hypothetical protein AAFY03_02090, partial [Pseudomonadota bacterium]